MRFVAFLVGAAMVALAAVELIMRPTAADRSTLALLFLSAAAVTALLGFLLSRLAARFRSLAHAVLVVSVGALVVVGAAVTVAAQLMFLSSHDLRLVLIVVGFGLLLGGILAVAVSRPLNRDLQRLSAAAERVTAGDLSTRTLLDRTDEVGMLATAMDTMISRLDESEQNRLKLEETRRSFIAAIGHDLRTPLTSLRAALEALQDGMAPDPDRYLATMGNDLTHLNGLVDDLFLLSRIEADQLDLDLEPVDLADATIEAMTPVARHRDIELHLEATTHVRVLAGELELARVMRNLLDNSIRHAPDGSRVTVRVAAETDSAIVQLTDQGPGFPGDIDVFETFVRGDSARARATGGAGLGLAIAKGLVEAHHGTIWIDPGPGGRIAFRMPLAKLDRA